MKELINKLKEFKASEGDKAAEEMEETIKEAIEQLQEKDKAIFEMAIYIAELDIDEDICKKTGKSNCDEMALGECEDCIIEYFTKKAREV